MLAIKTILVIRQSKGLDILPFSETIQLDATADDVLEILRLHFLNHWAARVHALRWIFPADLPIQIQDQSPSLVLYVDSPGRLAHADRRRTLSSCELDAIAMEATRPPHNQPWSHPEWLDNVSIWLRNTLGRDQVKEISQIRVTANGAVIKIRAAHETYFMKALPSFFAYERRLLTFLNTTIPAACPVLLPYEWDQRSHLTSSVGGPSLRTITDLETWKEALRTLGQIQAQSSHSREALRASGTPYREFRTFAATAEDSLLKLAAFQSGAPGQLTQRESDNVPKLATLVKAECDELLQFALPDTIVHGDCGEHNMFLTPTGNVKLIDWSFSRVCHPFFILDSLFDRGHPMFRFSNPLTDIYLQQWREHGSVDALKSAIKPALRLSSVETAVNALDYIMAFRKDTPSCVAFISSCLREALSRFGLNN